MNLLADALVDAIAYINMPSGDSDREDDDCRQLEYLAHMLDGCSKAEKKALIDATMRAIAKDPDPLLLNIYQEMLDDFLERF